MSRPPIIFAEPNQRQGVFHRRAFVLAGVAASGFAALVVRLAFLQLVEARKYRLQSLDNEVRLRLETPPRGRFVDRDGVVLATNRPVFRVYMSRQPEISPEAALERLQVLTGFDEAHRQLILSEMQAAPAGAPVVVLEDLGWRRFARVDVCAPELPGVTADVGAIRVYPLPAAFAHVIGYVGKVTARDLPPGGDEDDPILFDPGFRVGRAGLEKTFDLALRGRPGARRVEVDSRGRVVRDYARGDLPATPGAEIALTLDADAQSRALEVFGADSGAAIMMDCRSGDVLCMLSAPSFDANQFVKGVTAGAYQALTDDPRRPLLDKTISATYPPGSTFKTMVALAALAKGIPASTVHVCAGAWSWGGRVWHCDRAHGAIDMHEAIVQSCDIYFYQLALQIGGPDAIAGMARRFGLGRRYPIGLAGQRPGVIPDRAYKRRNFPKDPVWHPGETPSMGIGQGYVNVNALEQCVMCARIANPGAAVEPRLVRSVGGAPYRQPEPPAGALGVDPAHVAFLRAAMAEVVTRGTAAGQADLGLGPVVMAGKTGTAQTHSYRGGRGAHGAVGAWAERDDAWFIAFAPADDPRYAISVLVEHGGWGASAAAPKAREIMRVALLKDPAVLKRIALPLGGGETLAAAGGRVASPVSPA